MSEPFKALLPEGWARPRGYSYGLVAQGSRQIRVAGQLGVAPGARAVEPGSDFATQWRQVLANIVAVLAEAGAEPAHLVTLRAYVTDLAEFNQAGAEVGAAWAELLGRNFPPMTLLQVSALVDANAKVEVEAEAILP